MENSLSKIQYFIKYFGYLPSKMNLQLNFDSADSISDLTVEEMRKLIEYCSEEDKSRILEHIIALNSTLSEDILIKQKEIEKECKINRIFLEKCWRNLKKDEKKGCAQFFKELSDKFEVETNIS